MWPYMSVSGYFSVLSLTFILPHTLNYTYLSHSPAHTRTVMFHLLIITISVPAALRSHLCLLLSLLLLFVLSVLCRIIVWVTLSHFVSQRNLTCVLSCVAVFTLLPPVCLRPAVVSRIRNSLRSAAFFNDHSRWEFFCSSSELSESWFLLDIKDFCIELLLLLDPFVSSLKLDVPLCLTSQAWEI